MKNKLVKPLRATKADLDNVNYPVLATPKLDGIRCLTVKGVAMSKNMKPIPNLHVRKQLEGLNGLDGELMLNGDFNEVQSGIMSVEGEPDFTYCVFDQWNMSSFGYAQRVDILEWVDLPDFCKVISPVKINNRDHLDNYFDKCIAEGYEGIMIRAPNGVYKYGQSTVKEGLLLKVKAFLDSEGALVEVVEKMTNNNPLSRDELGRAKRSSNQANKTPAGTAGAVIIKWNGLTFNIGFGKGWTDAKKQEIWDRREELHNELVKFSYQELSKDGVPRFGKMLEIRHPDDL